MKFVWTQEEIHKVLEEQSKETAMRLVSNLASSELDVKKIEQAAADIKAYQKLRLIFTKEEI